MTTSQTRPAPASRSADPPPTRDVGRFVVRHPLLAFLGWFFTVGQAFAFAPLVLDAYGFAVPHQPFLVGSSVVGLLLPAVVITGLTGGRAGVVRYLRRLLPARISAGWYLLALVGLPVAALLVCAVLLGAPRLPAGGGLAAVLLAGFVLQLVLVLVPNNLAEEGAWAGFAQPRLQQRFGPVRGAVLTAVFFALQHVSLVVGNPPLTAVALMAFLVVVMVPYRFLTGWLWNRTQSLFLIGLVHAAGDAVTVGSGFGTGVARRLWADPDVPGVAHLLAFFVVGLVVLAATRGRLGLARGRGAEGPTHD